MSCSSKSVLILIYQIINFFYYILQIRHCHASHGLTSEANIKYETWKDVVEHSVRNPELVLQALQNRERFDLVREWIDVYGYPSHLREVGRDYTFCREIARLFLLRSQ
jgi:hypothetical protein